MSESLAVDLVLALYTDSYKSPSKPLPSPIKITNGKTTKPKKVKKESPTPGQHPPKVAIAPVVAPPSKAPATIGLPAAGSLDAAGFFLALRHAGMRRHADTGMLIRHPSLIVQDEKIAIAAFIGYNVFGIFGTQLEAARLKARFTLRPENNGKEYKRGTAATLAGFVRGCPDIAVRHLEDLMSRERLAVDLAIGYEKQAEECQNEKDKLIFTGKALVERERLSVIRQDMIDLATARAQK